MTAEGKARWHRWIGLALRMALGVGLLGALMLLDDAWTRLDEMFANLRWVHMPLFVAVNAVMLVVLCVRWRLFLSRRARRIPLHRLARFLLIGCFFDNLLPGMFGGDLAQAYTAGGAVGSQSQSMASVFLARLTGLVALVTLAVVFYAFSPSLWGEPAVAVAIVFFGGGLIILMGTLAKPHLLTAVLNPLRNRPWTQRLMPKLHEFHRHIVSFRRERPLIARALAWSFLFHVLTAVNVWAAALLLDVPAPLLPLIVITPIILLIASLPITPASIGVWEWAFTIYLASAGLEPSQGLAIALLLRGKELLLALIGGGLFIIHRTPKRIAEPATPLGVPIDQSV